MPTVSGDQMGRVGREGPCQDRLVFVGQIDGGGEILGEQHIGHEGCVAEKLLEPRPLLGRLQIPPRLMGGVGGREQLHVLDLPQSSDPCGGSIGSREQDVGIEEEPIHRCQGRS